MIDGDIKLDVAGLLEVLEADLAAKLQGLGFGRGEPRPALAQPGLPGLPSPRLLSSTRWRLGGSRRPASPLGDVSLRGPAVVADGALPSVRRASGLLGLMEVMDALEARQAGTRLVEGLPPFEPDPPVAGGGL